MPDVMVTEKENITAKHIIPEDVMSTLKKHMLIDGLDLVIDLYKSHDAYFYDTRKQKYYLDLFSFVASNPVGMNHPKMNNPEFINYIGKIALTKPSNSDIYCAEMAEFVDTFFNIAVPPYFKYAFFVEGGALAVENALKTAFDWKVNKNFIKGYSREVGHQVIHFHEAFHGRSGYTMSLTNTDPTKVALYPKFNWPRITNPKIKFPLNENNLDEVMKLEQKALSEIKKAISDNKDDIAALIIEPIQGEGGDNHFRKEFFEQLRIICDESDIMFIVDEVQTGVGMTGKWWAHQHFIQPDIIAFGKKSQVCGIIVSERVDEYPDNVFHHSSRLNSTWGGNLTDMMRFKKYLEIIEEDNLVKNAETVGDYLLKKLYELEEKYPNLVMNARGRGLFCAFDLPTPALRNTLRDKVLEKGAVMLGSGTHSIRFRPPLIITKEQIDEGIGIIDETLKKM
jgi:L-lysine 6-transaminase